MSDDVTEKKKRVHLTITAMHDAINDLTFAVHIPKDEALQYKRCSFIYRTEPTSLGKLNYICELRKVSADHEPDPAGGVGEWVMEAMSPNSSEEATALLLEEMKAAFEHHRAEVFKSMDAVLERHHGALRGARSKIREKKPKA